jgi:glyoxylase-like metal-dependent hydrolase (beta-lactamase superfamily II)
VRIGEGGAANPTVSSLWFAAAGAAHPELVHNDCRSEPETPMSSYSGEITTIRRGSTTFHTFTAPEAGFRVNTHIVESATDLTVIDTQLALPFAEEVVALLREIGKPVGQIIITHGHPDHFSGLQVVSAAFPEAPVYALQATRDYLDEWAQPVLDARRAAFGDIIAERAVYPTRTLAIGTTVFGGVTYSVEQVDETEAHAQALITFPSERVLASADMVVAPDHHLFLVIDGDENIPNWIRALERIGSRTDIDTVLTGHGPTTEPGPAAKAAIEWLRTAQAARASSPDAASYAATVKAQYPNHRDPIWADFASQMLYGLINP